MSQPDHPKDMQTGTKLPWPTFGSSLIMPRMRKDALIVQLDKLVCDHPDFEPIHEPALNGYCFRCVPNSLAERQDEPEVAAVLDTLNEGIVQALQFNRFAGVVTMRVRGRAAILVSFCSGKTGVKDVDETFEVIARWGHLLNKKLPVGNEPNMEAKLCSSGLHSSSMELSAI